MEEVFRERGQCVVTGGEREKECVCVAGVMEMIFPRILAWSSGTASLRMRVNEQAWER